MRDRGRLAGAELMALSSKLDGEVPGERTQYFRSVLVELLNGQKIRAYADKVLRDAEDEPLGVDAVFVTDQASMVRARIAWERVWVAAAPLSELPGVGFASDNEAGNEEAFNPRGEISLSIWLPPSLHTEEETTDVWTWDSSGLSPGSAKETVLRWLGAVGSQ